MLNKVLIAAICLLVPGVAGSSPLEVARLAQQLEYASAEIAGSAVAVSWSGSVKHNARLLSQKAQKLQDSVARGRSSAYIRTRFTDVTRYYQRLEASVIRSMDRSGTGRLRNEFIQLSEFYEDLRFEFYGDSYYQSLRSGPSINPYRYSQPWLGDPYSNGPGVGVLIVPRVSDYDRRGGQQHRAPVTARELRRGNNFQHRSPVQQRQRRNDRVRDLSGGRTSGRQSGVEPNRRIEANQGYYRLRQ